MSDLSKMHFTKQVCTLSIIMWNLAASYGYSLRETMYCMSLKIVDT